MHQRDTVVEFTLQPPGLSAPVAVRLRHYLDRWAAEVMGASQPVAIGLTAREALNAALAPLGDRNVQSLLADLGLLEPSLRVVRVERLGRGGAA